MFTLLIWTVWNWWFSHWLDSVKSSQVESSHLYLQWWPKLFEHLAYLRCFSCFCWTGHCNTHKMNYSRKYLRRPLSNNALTPSKSGPQPHRANLNWTDLLYIQRKTFGLSCRRHRITLVLTFWHIYWHYDREILLQLLQKVEIPNIKVDNMTKSEMNCPMNVVSYAQTAFKKIYFSG